MDDRALIAGFESQTVSRAEWTHRAHVRTAYLYLREHSFDDALGRIRSGILALNAANGVANTPTGGYHETITVAFMRIIASTLRHYGPAETSDAFCDAHPHLMTPFVLRLYYTRALINSPEARAAFIGPDIAPLP